MSFVAVCFGGRWVCLGGGGGGGWGGGMGGGGGGDGEKP